MRSRGPGTAGIGGGVRARVERGETGPVLVDVASEPGDLLVIGTGRRSLIAGALRKSVGRYCLAHATCPVLAVPPSPLMDEVGRGLLSWPLRRRRVLTPDVSDLSDK